MIICTKGNNQTGQFKEMVGILRMNFIFISEALFLRNSSRAKAPDDPQTGQIFRAYWLILSSVCCFSDGDLHIPDYDCQKAQIAIIQAGRTGQENHEDGRQHHDERVPILSVYKRIRTKRNIICSFQVECNDSCSAYPHHAGR